MMLDLWKNQKMMFTLFKGVYLSMDNESDIVVELPLRAIGKPRPRFTKRGGVYSDAKYKKFKKDFAWHIKAKEIKLPSKGNIFWLAECFYPDNRMPDDDNVVKALNDAMFDDDKLVCGIVLRHVEKGVEKILLRIWL